MFVMLGFGGPVTSRGGDGRNYRKTRLASEGSRARTRRISMLGSRQS